MSHRDKKLLYHLTEIANLPGILEQGLLSRAALREMGGPARDVADHEILGGRRLHGLEAMVPFHFINRSPFDYRVVHEHAGGRFVLISVYRSHGRSRGWSIVPRHPLVDHDPPEILSWQDGLDRIDWEQMDRDDRDYNDRDCRHACMAEALSPRPVPVANFARIYAASDETAEHVRQGLGRIEVPVTVNPRMFPRGCR